MMQSTQYAISIILYPLNQLTEKLKLINAVADVEEFVLLDLARV